MEADVVVQGRRSNHKRAAAFGTVAAWLLPWAAWLLPWAAWAAPGADLPAELAAPLQAANERLEARHLPAGHLVSKAREGVAKGVPLPRILAVLEQLERNTTQAGEFALLAGDAKAPRVPSPAAVLALTEALQAGAPTEHARRLAGQCRGRPDASARLAGAATLVADLLVAGHAQAAVFDLVTLALDRGFDAPDLANLGGAVARLSGADPSAMFQQIFARIQAGERPVPVDGIWSGASGAGGVVDVKLPPEAGRRGSDGLPIPPGGRERR
jgi:hypothetical protein